MNRKTLYIISALLTGAASQAQTWQFTLNMDGAYLGTGSTGTGGDLNQNYPADFPLITYDVGQHKFTAFDVGFGNANNFSPVTGGLSEPPAYPFEVFGPASGGGLGSLLYTFQINKQDAGSGSSFPGNNIQLVENPVPGYSIAQQESDLQNGLWSVVVPTDTFNTPGEIGGALTPVPEPQTYALVAAVGLAGFAVARKIRQGRPAVAS